VIAFALILVNLLLLVVLFHCFCEIKSLKTRLAIWKDAAGKPLRPPREWPR